MSNLEPIMKTRAAEIPIKDGQLITSIVTGEQGLYVDFGDKRHLITGEGSSISVAGLLQPVVNFTTDPQEQLNTKLNIGNVTRTATVVVGLESSGYTTGQVDVLIKPTDNVSDKITEAINKLPQIGGEIKILEGTYVFTEVLDIKKANVTFSFASWAAKFTGNISWLGIYSKGIIFNGGSLTGSNYIGTVVAGGEFILNSCYIVNNVKTNPIFDIQGSGVLKLNGTINVDGILASKTASNWQNIWVDGVSISPDGTVTMWQDGRMEKRGMVTLSIGANKINIALPAPGFINSNYTITVANYYTYSYAYYTGVSGTATMLTIDTTNSDLGRSVYYDIIGRWK